MIDQPDENDRNFCRSCGKPWVEHNGIQLTCAALIESNRLNDELLKQNRHLRERIEQLEEAARKSIDKEACLTRKLNAAIEKLREQTAQTLETADQIRAKVMAKLEKHKAIPPGVNLAKHPIEQNVGMCLAWLQSQIADSPEERQVVELIQTGDVEE